MGVGEKNGVDALLGSCTTNCTSLPRGVQQTAPYFLCSAGKGGEAGCVGPISCLSQWHVGTLFRVSGLINGVLSSRETQAHFI